MGRRNRDKDGKTRGEETFARAALKGRKETNIGWEELFFCPQIRWRKDSQPICCTE